MIRQLQHKQSALGGLPLIACAGALATLKSLLNSNVSERRHKQTYGAGRWTILVTTPLCRHPGLSAARRARRCVYDWLVLQVHLGSFRDSHVDV